MGAARFAGRQCIRRLVIAAVGLTISANAATLIAPRARCPAADILISEKYAKGKNFRYQKKAGPAKSRIGRDYGSLAARSAGRLGPLDSRHSAANARQSNRPARGNSRHIAEPL